MRFNTNNDTILVCMVTKANTTKSHWFKCVFYVSNVINVMVNEVFPKWRRSETCSKEKEQIKHKQSAINAAMHKLQNDGDVSDRIGQLRHFSRSYCTISKISNLIRPKASSQNVIIFMACPFL